MGEPTVIKLKEPIQNGTDRIVELTIRAPKAKDFRKLPMNPNMGDILDLVSRLSGQPPSVIDELGVEDLSAVSGVVENFIPGGRGAGSAN
jgi:hypothetical protein